MSQRVFSNLVRRDSVSSPCIAMTESESKPKSPHFHFLLYLASDRKIGRVQLVSGTKTVCFQGAVFSAYDKVTEGGKTLEVQVIADSSTLKQGNLAVNLVLRVGSKRFDGREAKQVKIELPTKVFSKALPTLHLPPISNYLWPNTSPDCVPVQIHFCSPKVEWDTAGHLTTISREEIELKREKELHPLDGYLCAFKVKKNGGLELDGE